MNDYTFEDCLTISAQLLIFTIDYRCVGNVLGIHSVLK